MAKRGYGEGSIYFDEKRKLWICEHGYTNIQTGKRERKKFAAKTQKEALAKGKAFIKSIENGLLSSASKITVGEWVQCWLNDYVKARIRPRTWEKYKSCMDCYILPRFQTIALKDLKAPDLQRYFNGLLTNGRKDGAGLSSSTVRASRRYLTMCLDGAIKAGLLTKNVAKQTDAPKLIKKEMVILSTDELDSLLTHAKELESDYMKVVMPVILRMALHTGMRQGEIFGLKWSDVNFAEQGLYIQRSLACVVGKGFVLQDPKTNASRRRVLLMPEDIEILSHYKGWQKSYIDELGDQFKNQDLVFCGIWGNPIHAGNFIRRYFKPLLKASNINEAFTFHGLRHTHATMLLRQGVNPKIVQERLGHGSIKITMDTYSHVLPDMQNVAVEALRALFSKKDDKSY